MMKKTLLLFSVLLLSSAAVPAQSILGNLLKGKKETTTTDNKKDESNDEKKDGNNTLKNILDCASSVADIIKTSTTSEEMFYGDWIYSEPAVVFESDDIENSAGGIAAAKTLETQIAKYFDKVGISKGKINITFAKDKTVVMHLKESTINGIWEYDPKTAITTINLNPKSKTECTATIFNGKLKILYRTDGLLAILSQLSANSTNTTLQSIGGIVSEFTGMQIGLGFEQNVSK